MSQPARLETLQAFKDGETQLLVASDVAARGLDLPKVSHVFNFDVPSHAEDYVHRIGRTGRAGREGRAHTIATPDDAKFLDAVVKFIGREIEHIAIDGVESVDMDAPPPRRSRRSGKRPAKRPRKKTPSTRPSSGRRAGEKGTGSRPKRDAPAGERDKASASVRTASSKSAMSAWLSSR